MKVRRGGREMEGADTNLGESRGADGQAPRKRGEGGVARRLMSRKRAEGDELRGGRGLESSDGPIK